MTQMRAWHAGQFSFERSAGFNLRRAIAVAAIAGIVMIYVGGKVAILRVGYRIETLEREKRGLERENRALLIEAASLASPARIEDIAIKRLGMIRPDKDKVVPVRRRPSSAGDVQTP